MKVLITGATGLIGNEIVRQCNNKGIGVHVLTTSGKKQNWVEGYKSFFWNPGKGTIDAGCFDGVDAIINLAGATISKRWTPSYKKKILQSRLQSLQLLRDSLDKVPHHVGHIISASAIGIYPNSLTNYYEESSQPLSKTFLGQVATQWEIEADAFLEIGLTVTKVRIGLVLSGHGGALPQMAKPIKMGLGAVFGTGEQWQSWIHITDLANLFLFLAEHRLEGVYNGVAPNPVTNTELTKAIAATLHMPLWLPKVPRLALRLALGEMHALLVESHRVSSKVVEDVGFTFKYHHLQLALEDLLTK